MALPGTAVRIPGVVVAALLVLLCAVAVAATPDMAWAGCKHRNASPREISGKQARNSVVCLINKRRARRGIGRLNDKADLHDVARGHSRYMRDHGCFDHECPGERSLLKRLRIVDYLLGSLSWGYGENIAWGRGRSGGPRLIVRGWMHSDGHRHNMLDPRWEHIGVGVVWGRPNAPRSDAGTYTADFGYRKG